MSRRTAESNKAILAAWNKEQELVQEGTGTREWTPKQQQDILEKGKAYDEDGVAFQGQHMKSAEMYPEYQGDPGNIQFLTRAEHLEAHNGNWKNPTNWYFNPVTKEKIDFGDGPFIPCKIIPLPEPVVKLNVEVENDKKSNVEAVEDNAIKASQSAPIQRKKPKTAIVPKTKVGIGEHIKNAFSVGAKAVVEFPVKHPTTTKVLKGLGIAATAITAEALSELSKNNSSHSEYRNRDTDSKREYDSPEELEDLVDDNYTNDDVSEPPDRPYTPNDVPAGKQRYHYKDGSVRWKDKPSYHRGGKKDE